jgi:ATP-dependent exoDNAse (exonuclease V) alpha subunit
MPASPIRPPGPTSLPAVELCGEQASAIEQLDGGRGAFFFVTGKAGTGKSTVLRTLAERWADECVVVAPTGLAAVQVGGQTVHSLFGLPLGPIAERDEQIRTYRRGHPKRRVLERARAVIIDEVSMVRADILDAVDWSLRTNCEPDLPFGGKTIVAFGDLWQLEPVVEEGGAAQMLCERYASPFFFDSTSFRSADVEAIVLAEVHRQTDAELLWALDRVREGHPDGLDFFNQRVGAPVPEDGRVSLTATNARANAVNTAALARLPGTSRGYQAVVTGEFGAQFPTDTTLVLKPGAQVMFAKNGAEWQNGELGRVVACGSSSVHVEAAGRTHEVEPVMWEKLRYTWDSAAGRIGREVVGTFCQLPLRPAWATTVHKAQGLTLDRLCVDFDVGAFAHGQAYVALSRCRSVEGLTLTRALTPADLVVDEAVVRFSSRMLR